MHGFISDSRPKFSQLADDVGDAGKLSGASTKPVGVLD